LYARPPAVQITYWYYPPGSAGPGAYTGPPPLPRRRPGPRVRLQSRAAWPL